MLPNQKIVYSFFPPLRYSLNPGPFINILLRALGVLLPPRSRRIIFLTLETNFATRRSKSLFRFLRANTRVEPPAPGKVTLLNPRLSYPFLPDQLEAIWSSRPWLLFCPPLPPSTNFIEKSVIIFQQKRLNSAPKSFNSKFNVTVAVWESNTNFVHTIFLFEVTHFQLGNQQLLVLSHNKPGPAPYQRLKNSKRTSKCQSIGEKGTLWWVFLIKSLTMTKKREPLWIFNIHSVTKLRKKVKGRPFGDKFFSTKMSHNAEKTQRWEPLVSPGIVCYAEKVKTFLLQFSRPNGSIWHHKIS